MHMFQTILLQLCMKMLAREAKMLMIFTILKLDLNQVLFQNACSQVGNFAEANTAKLALGEIAALTHYLCKLHNFCIDERENRHCDETKIDRFYSSLNR